jgi:hypothetical protein
VQGIKLHVGASGDTGAVPLSDGDGDSQPQPPLDSQSSSLGPPQSQMASDSQSQSLAIVDDGGSEVVEAVFFSCAFCCLLFSSFCLLVMSGMRHDIVIDTISGL